MIVNRKLRTTLAWLLAMVMMFSSSAAWGKTVKKSSRPKTKTVYKNEYTTFTAQPLVQYDSQKPADWRQVLRQAKPGKVEKKYKLVYQNNKLVKKELVKQRVVAAAQPALIIKGGTRVASRGGAVSRGGERDVKKVMQVLATAYTHTGRRTATGIWPYRGVVAVDPRAIPFGTRLWIEGYGEGIAADMGSGIKGNRIDLFFNSYGEAINWGMRNVTVYVLER